MILNNLKTSWRNILRNKMTSLVNISGLAIGLSVAMLIGIWIWDELSFNKYHTRYDQIDQMWQFVLFGAKKIFIIVALLTMIITLVTVSFQALKAAIVNPLKKLRSE